jgi:Rrf2 family protein
VLKVPQKLNLALLLLRRLAENQAGGHPMSLDGVSQEASVSQGYLEEVARLLRAAGLVAGRRGLHGGYVLAKPATDISVADAVVAVLGSTWSAECLSEKPTRQADAASSRLWRKVQGQVMTTLGAVTISELAAQHSEAAVTMSAQVKA